TARIALHIDTQEFAEECIAILTVILRVPGRPAIPHPDVKVTIGTETDLTAVMIGKRLEDLEQHGFACGIGYVGVRGDSILGDDGVAVEVGVVDVEALRLGKASRKRQSQQPALSIPLCFGAYVEEWLRVHRSVTEHANETVLLNEKK